MTFASALSLPDLWSVTHIISLGPSWQINANDGEYTTFATGDTIEEALVELKHKIACGSYIGRLYTGAAPTLEFTANLSLAQRLGLVPKAPVITRRL